MVRKVVLFLLVSIVLFAGVGTFLILTNGLKNKFNDAVKAESLALKSTGEKITDSSLSKVPPLIQKYLRKSGFVGKDKIHAFRAVFDTALRNERNAIWMSAVTQHEDFFQKYSRNVYLTALMKGLPIAIWHSYSDYEAKLMVRLVSLLPITDLQGTELSQTELVMLLNDISLFAPGALVDARISWRTVDKKSVEATLTNGTQKVKAILSFNNEGELKSFVSTDAYFRSADAPPQKEKWSTVVTQYVDFNGYHLPKNGDAIWHLKEGDFNYSKFTLVKIEYNP